MYATRRHIFQSGTPSRTTLPLALTKQLSANGNIPRLVFHHHSQHRLPGEALEFVNDIVELLEIEGGLVAARQLDPAKNQAVKLNFNQSLRIQHYDYNICTEFEQR